MKDLKKKLWLPIALLTLSSLILYLVFPKIIALTARHLTGHSIAFEEIKAMSGYIRGLKISGGDFSLESAHIKIGNPLIGILNNHFDEISLYNPSLYITQVSAKERDLSFIKNLPRVNKLTIERGSVIIADRDSKYEVTLSSMKLTLKDYSPQRGGQLDIEMFYSIKDRINNKKLFSGLLVADSRIHPFITKNISMSGSFSLSLDNTEAGFIGFGSSMVKGSFIYENGGFSLDRVDANFSSLSLEFAEKKVFLGNLQLNTAISFDTQSMDLQFINISGALRALGKITGTIDIKLDKNYPYHCNLTLHETDIQESVKLLKPIIPDSLNKWNLSGKTTVEAILKGSMQDSALTLEGVASINLAELAFASEDGLKAGQGISGKLVIDIRYPQDLKKNTPIALKIASDLSKGEYLWDRFYLNQPNRTLKAMATLNLKTTRDNPNEIAIETDLFSTGSYRIFISDKSDSLNINAVLSDINLKELYKTILMDSLHSILPITKDMDISGGVDINMDVHISEKRYSLDGAIDIKGLSLWTPSIEMGIEEVSASLPIHINESNEEGLHRYDDAQGFLSVQRAKIRNIELRGLHMPLRAEQNLILLSAPIETGLLGGKLSIEAVEAGLSIREPIWLKTSFRLNEAMVAPITESLGFGSFSGRLNSHISDVKLKGRTLSTEGYIEIDIFKGRVLISNIHGEMPFNYFGADIDFSGIDLERLTETIKIGRITGIIKGSIKGLEIQYGQAASFVMDIESVPTEDVKQTVSTDAVENISILGTGSEGISRVLSTGINQFFKEFPYRKLGIRCVLENDVFTIRGKIFEGGKEYIIKRGLFRGIDVIVQNPDNSISFKDMQNRLAAIFEQHKSSDSYKKSKEE